ncbi:MAG: hypothetical protein M1828_000800 [Chrysothrix sp. TS-e1954]|nr:MAG: hypothetical protein M1828_000800 [Chrysothrix sp. TS-e1954]
MPPTRQDRVSKGKTQGIKGSLPETTCPQWPALSLTNPKHALQLRTVRDGQIVTISDFWSQALCKQYVKFLAQLPLITTPGKPKKGDAVRVNDRYQIEDAIFADRLWKETGLKDLILNRDESTSNHENSANSSHWGGEVLGLSPNIRVYRYQKGQYFDQHYDDSNTITCQGIPARTTWTLLLYLTSANEGCVGGETVFYPERNPGKGQTKSQMEVLPLDPIAVPPKTGMALLHKHGKDCMLHEGKEVLEGEKWVIRSDLCVKR